MSNKFDEILRSVAEESFASLAFMLPVDPDGPVETHPGPPIVASISFDGPMEGVLFLAVSTGIVPELASNMLGLDVAEGPASPDQEQDALKELLNVICGNLLPEIAGREAIFNVDAPAIASESSLPETYGHHDPAAGASLCLDAGEARLVLFISSEEVTAVPPKKGTRKDSMAT